MNALTVWPKLTGRYNTPGGRLETEVPRATASHQIHPNVNWYAALAHHAARSPRKAMTIFEGRPTTYAEMAGRVATPTTVAMPA